MKKDTNIPVDGTFIIGLDTLAAFLIGLVIFPAIFSIGLGPDSGASLLFVTMSNLFSHMPGGMFFGGMFFLLLFLAAISSGIGYLESVVMTCTELFKMNRTKAVILSLSAIFIVGLPNILAHGIWSHILIGGRNLFDFSDYLSGNIMMPLGALILAFYTLFVWKFEGYQKDANIGANRFKVFSWWAPFVKYVIPIILVIIFVTGLV